MTTAPMNQYNLSLFDIERISCTWLNIRNTNRVMRCKIMFKNKLGKRLDQTDIEIIDLMVLSKNDKEISQTLKIPFQQYREGLET